MKADIVSILIFLLAVLLRIIYSCDINDVGIELDKINLGNKWTEEEIEIFLKRTIL